MRDSWMYASEIITTRLDNDAMPIHNEMNSFKEEKKIFRSNFSRQKF